MEGLTAKLNSNGVDWRDIITIPEFIEKLEFEDLKKVSLLNKFSRFKLNPILFTNVQFNRRNFKIYLNNSENNLLWEYFNCLAKYSSRKHIDSLDYSCYKDFKVEYALTEIRDQLNEVKHLIKNFNYSSIEDAGYYMFPILNTFKNLTSLELIYCTIPLTKFNELSNSLKKLKSIQLYHCKFIKLPADEFSLEDIQFPSKLQSLTLFECQLCSNSLLSNPYNLLFDKANSSQYEPFIIPPTSIPTLLKLVFFPNSLEDGGLNQFLKSNPQLENLRFKSCYLDQFKLDHFENTQSLKKLEFTYQYESKNTEELKIPTLSSIKELEFEAISLETMSNVQNLCLSSPKLATLSFIMVIDEDYTPILDVITNSIVPSCPSLKNLDFYIFGHSREILNFSKLVNVEVLSVEAELDTILSIEFASSNSLKSVHLIYWEDELISDTDKEKFKSLNNEWKFEFRKQHIKGYKV
jgi:hypothetical protein